MIEEKRNCFAFVQIASRSKKEIHFKMIAKDNMTNYAYH